MAAQDVAARALGEGSRAYALAFEVSRVAVLLVFLPVFPFATLLHAVRLAVSDTDEPDEVHLHVQILTTVSESIPHMNCT
jgi:hypothetical protein